MTIVLHVNLEFYGGYYIFKIVFKPSNNVGLSYLCNAGLLSEVEAKI